MTGIGLATAQVIVAEIGLDMAQFPTPGHLVSWAKVAPRTVQSRPRSRSGKTGKGIRYLKRVLGEAAAAAAKTDTFLGARHRRLVKRTGKAKALVAIERSILVVVWHLLADPNACFVDLGADFYVRFTTTRKGHPAITTEPKPDHDEHGDGCSLGTCVDSKLAGPAAGSRESTPEVKAGTAEPRGKGTRNPRCGPPLGRPWVWSRHGLTDIHHKAPGARKDVHHDDERARNTPRTS